MFSNESSFEIFHQPNRQNDRAWAHRSSDVAPTETVKQPLKIMAWAMMSYQGSQSCTSSPAARPSRRNTTWKRCSRRRRRQLCSRRGRRGQRLPSNFCQRRHRRFFNRMAPRLTTRPGPRSGARTTCRRSARRACGPATALTCLR